MSEDPKRLLETEEVGDILRHDLEHVAGLEPGYDVSSGLERFEQARMEVPVGDAAAATSGGSSLVSWALGLIGAGVLVAAIVAGVRDDAPPAPRPPTPAVQSPPAPARDAEPAEPAPVVAPEVEPTSTPEEKQVRKPTSRSKPTKAIESDDDRLKREMAATKRARAALDHDPASALKLARAAEREFKGGLFGEERQAVIVLSLARLGRAEQASEKGKAFLARYPRSTWAERVRRAIQ